MGKETERKFLVRGDCHHWKQADKAMRYKQGYLNDDKERTVRVRVAGQHAFLTVKGLKHGCTGDEFEYSIPQADAEAMLNNMALQPLIEKIRYTLEYAGFTWEVDEFLGDNAGLVVAEIELPDEQCSFALPPFIGMEVTGDARYYNTSLAKHPFSRWEK